jgi:SAM-dependent methyltransferase/glycosyltransferase involved in cell wall biosynthesis
MTAELEHTGERFIPGDKGEIKYEHLHRYLLAQVFVKDKAVLDIACGEGYGAAMLSKTAGSIIGVDIDEQVIEYAGSRYSDCQGLEFRRGSCDAIPLADDSVDVVTSFETIEHHDRHREMMLEIKRVLRPGGILIISSPNRPIYSEQTGFHNPFHVKELDYEEFEDLLKQHFKHVEFYGQKLAAGSFIFPLNSRPHSYTAYAGDGGSDVQEAPHLDSPRYFVAVCSDAEVNVRQALDSVYLDGYENLFQEMLDELNNLRAEQQRVITAYEQHRHALEDIRTSFGVRFASHVLWPLSSFLPVTLRSRIKRTVRRLKGGLTRHAVDAGEQALRWKVDVDLSQPFVVGRGNLLYLSGWCFHTQKRIKQLSVMVDGVARQVFNHSLAEEEAFKEHSQPFDHAGNSLSSGFWTTIPFEEVDAPREVKLSLHAVLEDEKEAEAGLGSLRLLPSEPSAQVADLPERDAPPSEPRVVICMATYNPPLDLFTRQFESITKQTHSNWSCIINDDCSDPATFEEIQRIAGQDSRFRVYRNPERLGFYRNFERCLKLVPPASVDFIAFSDQDDEWYEDKLASCLKEFKAEDVQMVYSDMNIVARDGQLISNTYWTTRRNNYTDLEALLLANTVTGAAVVFRASLLDDLLPFPRMDAVALYHDHWVACVALTRGRIEYVDRPLYAYRQHSDNVIGHVTIPPARVWPEFLGVAGMWNLLARRRTDSSQYLPGLYSTYRALPVRISFIAGVLRLRLKDAAAEKRAVLKRLERFEYSLPTLFRQALKYKMTGRSTLGVELICLRSTIGVRLLKTYHRLNRRRLIAAHTNGSYALKHERTPAVLDANGEVDFIPQKIAPLRLDISQTTKRRLNLLISTVELKYLFAGYLSMFNLALRLRASGYATRFVIVDYCDYDPAEWNRRLGNHDGLQDLFTQVETAYLFNRSTPLKVSPHDAFIATSWWTAHIAHHAVRSLKRERFIYLIQDYEPLFYPASSFYALAEQSYTFPHDALFSTGMLRDYFRENGIGVYANGQAERQASSSMVFQNAVNHFKVSESELRERKSRRVLFYARPEQSYFARNMFELGVLSLRQAIGEGHFELERWEFHGMGAVNRFRNVPLYGRAELKMLPRLTLQEYCRALPAYDLGLSLMHTPHPSLTPLDMASAGLVTVTNTYATKTAAKLSEISGNIIAVPPTAEGIKSGLIRALSEVEDFRKRAEGARLNWSASWEETFDADVMAAIRQSVGW